MDEETKLAIENLQHENQQLRNRVDLIIGFIDYLRLEHFGPKTREAAWLMLREEKLDRNHEFPWEKIQRERDAQEWRASQERRERRHAWFKRVFGG